MGGAGVRRAGRPTVTIELSRGVRTLQGWGRRIPRPGVGAATSGSCGRVSEGAGTEIAESGCRRPRGGSRVSPHGAHRPGHSRSAAAQSPAPDDEAEGAVSPRSRHNGVVHGRGLPALSCRARSSRCGLSTIRPAPAAARTRRLSPSFGSYLEDARRSGKQASDTVRAWRAPNGRRELSGAVTGPRLTRCWHDIRRRETLRGTRHLGRCPYAHHAPRSLRTPG